ncbi:DUF5103 domain-containing protein [Tenacibaculum sp. IB213877]|uniref:type IX secretion system plug protein n=1 Tax=Tenacibaculum sp. IB213877 TaxID=3097351 RepID=UPI002A5A5F56|nr:DUF5103 domain-containing protein [Tenacibaculum sp. IB213877]MDY0781588.1 DUF5103 domain-containing protein [Tenacibaculum sp. IB213877]
MKHLIKISLLLISTYISGQNIKTVQLRPLSSNQFAPIVKLGEILELSFDDLDADNKQYQYKIEHMTHDWKPSNLLSNQYIQGFNQNYFTNITNSFNTLQDYTHYSIKIPNENTTLTKSGNYLISVLDENLEVVFTRKCVFYEDLTTVGVAVFRSRNVATLNKQQTVQFVVNHPKVSIINPTQEIKVTLLQNNNWNININNIEPHFIKPNQLVYNHTTKTNFWGGNEFLNFDNKYIRSTNINIAKTERLDVVHNYLYLNEPRAYKPYSYNPDINGQFIVRTLDAQDEDTEADYATVHFSLKSEKLNFKEIFVHGAFNNFELTDENKMEYNENEKTYTTSLQLKQGFYNYGFATKDQNGNVSLTEIDGSFYQTENEYTAIIYYKPFGEIYDRVIGVGFGFFDQNR